jgi:protein SCO1
MTTAARNPLHGLAGTFALCLGVLVAGLTAIFQATAGGTAFTTETLRRTTVAQAPVAVPDFPVVDAQGQAHSLRSLLVQGGRVVIVDFVYTRCTTLCLALGTVFQQLQAQIVEQGLQQRVGLLSISFDPLQDQPPALAAYAQRMRMQPAVWQLVSLRSDADRRRLLDSFGIMVVPAPLGEFEHNAALHIVSPQGQLVRILGLEDGDVALEMARSLAAAPQQSGAP